MNNWLPLNKLTAPAKVFGDAGTGRWSVSLSPYDVPQAIRGYVTSDEKDHRFLVIELKYLTDEPKIEKIPDKFTRIEVGQNSNRVYRIKLDQSAIEESCRSQFLSTILSETLQKAIDSTEKTALDATSQPGKNRITEYFDLTKRTLLENSDIIIRGLEEQAA